MDDKPIANPKLEKARLERLEILRIVNTPGLSRQQRVDRLKELGFAEVLIDELLRGRDVSVY